MRVKINGHFRNAEVALGAKADRACTANMRLPAHRSARVKGGATASWMLRVLGALMKGGWSRGR